MEKNIQLSPLSQELINTLAHSITMEASARASFIERAAVLEYLNDSSVFFEQNKDKITKDLERTLFALRTALLHDFLLDMEKADPVCVKAVKNEISSEDKIKLVVLLSAGVLVAASEGFDSAVTMLSLFSLPGLVILAAALLVSFCSVIAFCGFELVKLSSALRIRLSDVPELLDVSLQQFTHIKGIRRKISTYKLNDFSQAELAHLAEIMAILEQRQQQLMSLSDTFDAALNTEQMQMARLALSMVTSALFFGSGFCSGQTVSVFILSFFMTTVTSASVPVLLFSIFVGAAAFSLYWCIEFPGLKGLINSWFSLDEKKIAMLCDREKHTRESTKLAFLREHINAWRETKKHSEPMDKEPEHHTPAPIASNGNNKFLGENSHILWSLPTKSTLSSENLRACREEYTVSL